nr:putative ribonuclease H-like domain-containing protein [Tanacetum cinerariifolium]
MNGKFEAYTIANDANMNDLQFKLDKFQKNQQDFQEKFEQMQDDFLNQMMNFMQNLHDGPPGVDKEHEATTDTELPSTKDIQPLPKQSMEDTMLELVKICQEKEFLCNHNDIDDLIESALDSKLLLINSNSQRLDKKEQEVKNIVEQPAERGNRSIQSLQNFRDVHKSSISFRDTSQISSIHAVAPLLSTKEPEHLLSMGYEHFSITPETEFDEVTESNAENLLPIQSKCEVTLVDKKECDLPISENSPVCDDNSNTFFDSKIDYDISVYDDDFEDIEYIEASLSDPKIASVEEIVSVEEENVVQQEEEEVDFEDISQIQYIVLRKKLLSIICLISNIESLNDNSTPDHVLNSFESDNSLLDNFSPEFETFYDHLEETRSGKATHADNSLPEYDSFCFEIEPDQERLINLMKNDISDLSNNSLLEKVDLFLFDNSIPSGIENVADDPNGDIRFDNPLIPRPPPKPPDAETDAGEEIPVVMIVKDKFDDDYQFFMFDKVFSLLFAESEDTIFDPVFYLVVVCLCFMIKQDLSPVIEAFLCWIFQNGIAERKNKTLIEAARTMLADSLLPIPFWAEAVNTACYLQNRVLVTKPHCKTPYELLHGRTPSISFMRPFGCHVTILNTLDPLGKFEGKVDEGFLVRYSVNSKAFRVFNSRTRIVQETLHVNFLENKPNIAGTGPTWLFDIDSLTRTMNYQPVTIGNQSNPSAGFQEEFDAGKAGEEANQQYMLFLVWSTGSSNPQNKEGNAAFDGKEHHAEKPESVVNLSPSSSALSGEQDDMTKKKDKGKSTVEYFTGNRDLNADFKDYSEDNSNNVSAAGLIFPTAGQNYSNSTNPISVAGPSNSLREAYQPPNMLDREDIAYSDHENVGAEADFNNLETSITVSPIPTTRTYKDHPVSQIIGIDYEEVFAPVERIEAIRLFLAYGSFMGFMVYQMDVKSAFLYGTIEEEVYVCQPSGFKDSDNPDNVYKVVKVLYGLHQAPRAWYETLANYLLENGFHRGQIDQTLFIKKQKGDILLVQIYVDDIIFGATNKNLCKSFEKLMKDKFQMSSMGELTFFLGLQVKQKKNGIFISQDKYVAEILKKFGLTEGKSASTPIDTEQPLQKDPDGEDVDSNDVTRLQALVDKKKVVVTEAAIRDTLHLDDAEGVDCLPNEEIFTALARMGYENPSTKLSFYKAFFSSQWKFIIHTILQSMSAKCTSWNEFSSAMASAVICLSTGRDLSTHTTKYISPALTQKVFANIRRVGKGCSGVKTPLFEGMLVAREPEEQGDAEEHGNDNNVAVEHVTAVLENDVENQSIPSPTPSTPPPQ